MIPKFRAWDKILKKMFYGKLEVFDDSVGFRFGHFEDNEPIFMQSTGLKDKNGIEVFEGDIVEVSKDFLNIIDYRVDDGCWRLRPIDKKWACSYFSNYYDKSGWEILGNIYEDKELLK